MKIILLILLSVMVVGCSGGGSNHNPTIVFKFIDNMDDCTPTEIALEINGEIVAEFAAESGYTVPYYGSLDSAEVYFDFIDPVCGDSTLHTQITTTDSTRSYPFYY